MSSYDLDIPFTLPGTAIVGHQSVLSFMLKLKDPDDLKFKISIVNGKEVEHTVVSCTAQLNIWRAFQEVVDPNVLTP